jgi:hypothetical protein
MPRPLNGSHFTSEDDLAMMRNPKDWPLWPYLPVKLRPMPTDRPSTGFLRELDGTVEPIVYADALLGGTGVRRLAIFDSFEELVEAGWMVD